MTATARSTRFCRVQAGPFTLGLGERDGQLCRLMFPREMDGTIRRRPDTPLLREAADQLTAYFDGRLKVFDLPLLLEGTPFRKSVWTVLRTIPWGTTISYADLARRVGRPSAARAVGGAVGANPIPVVVPCHRIVTSDGRLGGFGGGLSMKHYLLDLEGILFENPVALDDGARSRPVLQ